MFERLVKAYGEPERAYHTMDHVLDCLDRLDESESPHADRDVVEMAIWFHDYVYDASRWDNEMRSAALAYLELMAAGVGYPTLPRVPELIKMTAHAAQPAEPDGRLLCDIDLSILGGGDREFDDYQNAIRKEYAWVPEPEYRAGRSKVLSAFLGRARIYLTDDFHRRYEAAARRNLERALAALQPETTG